MNMGRKLLTVGVAGALGLSGAIASAAPSMARSVASTAPAASTAPVALTGSVPAFPRGAVRLGPLSAGTKIHLDVTLKVRDQAALTAFLANLSNRQSPVFHHFLKAGQFGPRFGPTLATVSAVRAALRQAGLSPGQVTSNRLSIPVTASAAAIERAFGVSLARYRLTGGRIGYANTAAP